MLIEGGTEHGQAVHLQGHRPHAGLRRLLQGHRRAARGRQRRSRRSPRSSRCHPFAIDADQKFTSPPPRYTEASLIKTLESEGIGRPSTYASIISVIQDRKYVEQIDRRFYATDLGEVVTDKLIEAFPKIMDVGYTREMEGELDKVEEDHLDWVEMLHRFYGPFSKALEDAHETHDPRQGRDHARAQGVPLRQVRQRPGLPLRQERPLPLLLATTPTCNYACPVDREGKPRPAEHVNVACPKCGGPMIKRTGRFGPFLGLRHATATKSPNPCDGILNIDKKGYVVAPSQPAAGHRPALPQVPVAR